MPDHTLYRSLTDDRSTGRAMKYLHCSYSEFLMKCSKCMQIVYCVSVFSVSIFSMCVVGCDRCSMQ